MNCCNHNCNQGRNCPARVAKIDRNCPARAAKWVLIGIAAALFAATVLLGVRA